MAPAFGFGVGDFIAAVILLKQVIGAFNDAQGARATYTELSRELSSIQSALESIETLKSKRDPVHYDAVIEAVKRCQECVERFLKRVAKYEDLLRIPGQPRWSLPVLKRQIHKIEWALCKKSDVEQFRKELKPHMVSILSLQSTLLSGQMESQRELSYRINTSVNTQLDLVKDIHSKISTADYLEHRECLRSLFITDPAADRTEIENRKDSLMEDSCEWILRNSHFKKFVESDKIDEILWIHGEPGKGKTMIAIFLVDIMSKRIAVTDHTILCYFFCDNTDARRNTALNALKSVLHQILKQIQNNVLLSDFKTQGTQMFSSVEAVWMCLTRVLENINIRTVNIIIDGLDECDRESLDALLGLVHGYQGPKSKISQVRWIFTSRNEPIIREYLGPFIDIDLQANSEEVVRAVNAFIDLKAEELAVRKSYDILLKEFVINSLREKSEGTFLWVSLACCELRKRNVSSVNTRLVLGKLPPGLSRLYERILDQVATNEIEEMVEIALEILRVVIIALRPLNFGELAVMAGLPSEAAISFRTGREYAEQCGSFLTFRKEYVYLVHQSAKDYLVRHRQTRLFPGGLITEHEKAAMRCLHFASQDWQRCRANRRISSIQNSDSEEPPEIIYPLTDWVEHSNLASEKLSENYILDAEFFRRNSTLRREWLHCFKKHANIPNIAHVNLYKFSALHISAICGTVWVARKLLESSRKFIDFEDCWGMTPLHWTVQAGTSHMVELLLSNGANPNHLGKRMKAKGPRRSTPLGLAASFNNIEIARLLIGGGANVNLQDKAYMTPLTWSVTKNAPSVTALLLEHGANVNIRNPIGKSPLHLAAALGNVNVVRILLDGGAYVNASDADGCSPVHEAVINGHDDVTGLLSARGASKYDINQAQLWSVAEKNKKKADESARMSADSSPLRSWGAARSGSGPSGSKGYGFQGAVQPGTTVPALRSWGFMS